MPRRLSRRRRFLPVDEVHNFEYADFYNMNLGDAPTFGIASVNAYFADNHESFEDFAWYHEVLGTY